MLCIDPPEDHRDLAAENSFLDGQNANRRKEINKYPSRVIACLLHVGRVRAPVKSQEMFNLRKGRERDTFPDQNRTLLFPPSTAPPFAFLEKKFKRPPPSSLIAILPLIVSTIRVKIMNARDPSAHLIGDRITANLLETAFLH